MKGTELKDTGREEKQGWEGVGETLVGTREGLGQGDRGRRYR